MFRCLADAIRRERSARHPHPRHDPRLYRRQGVQQLGARCYGFSPVRFEPNDGISFAALYHGKDERIPEAGLRWGLRTL